jgi:hypothetical protein
MDFISENLIPWTIHDVRRFTYVLQPTQVRTPEQVLREAQLLRTYGAAIGEPGAVANPPFAVPVLNPPVP